MKTIIHTEDNGRESVIIYIPDVLPLNKKSQLLDCLKSLNYKRGYNYEGKQLSREHLWFQEDNKYFCESWKERYDRWTSNTYPSAILDIQNHIQSYISNLPLPHKPIINSCLINYYKDGTNFIAAHRDNEISFGKEPTIIGISIGAKRSLILKHINKDLEYTLELADNSIFIMAGASQLYFLHEIPRDMDCLQERWSLTFREYINKI